MVMLKNSKITVNKNVGSFKSLTKIPNYIDGKQRVDGDVTIVELGTGIHFHNWMKDHSEYKSKSKSTSMREDDYKKWSGASDWDDYLDILDNGDSAVMKKIKTETGVQVRELGKKYREVIQAYKFNVTGQFFDVGLVVTGVPEAWLEPEIEVEEVVQVEIIINGTYSSKTKSSVVIKNSARVLAMAKILEDHDIQVKLRMITAQTSWTEDTNQNVIITSLVLKDYSEPINYRKLTSFITPAHLRRGKFKLMEVMTDKVAYGYGYPLSLTGMIDLGKDTEIDKLETKLFKGGKDA